MAYEFKKLGDVEVVETPMDTANVLIEEDGVIKKVAKDEVGGVKVASAAEVGQTIVVKAVDENGNPTEWECADFPEGVKSWNELEDKPFYEQEAEPLFEGEVNFPETNLFNLDNPIPVSSDSSYIAIVDGVECQGEYYFDDTGDGDSMYFKKDGQVVFALCGGNYLQHYGAYPPYKCYLKIIDPSETVIKQIDPKFIPEGTGGGDSIIFDVLLGGTGQSPTFITTGQEVAEALEAGKLPVARFDESAITFYDMRYIRYYYYEYASSDGDYFAFRKFGSTTSIYLYW